MKCYIKFMVIIGLLIAPGGCGVNWCGSGFRAKYERSEELTFPMAGIGQLEVDSQFGAINITGSDNVDCHIIAKITSQAPSAEQAQEICENAKLIVEPEGGKLRVYLNVPKLGNNRSVGAAFTITLPRAVAVDAHTSFGAVSINGIQGSVKAVSSFGAMKFQDILGSLYGKTSFGAINCHNVTGPVELNTSHGSITCNELTTDQIKVHTSFGAINIGCTNQSSPALQAAVTTSHGSLTFDVPDNFAGSIDAGTSFGEINTAIPVTIKGAYGKDRLSGTVGSGSGSLNLKTSFGSVKIK